MDKLTKQQLSGISELVHLIHDENVLQYILETISKENWTRDVLGNCHLSLLTEEQEDILESLGGLYDWEEIEEHLHNDQRNVQWQNGKSLSFTGIGDLAEVQALRSKSI